MNVMEQGNRLVPYFYKRKNYSTKNVELAMWVWVVWGKCGKELCGETVENNNMGKVWKNCEKNSVGKMWKTITWENCGNFVKRIVWKKCGEEYCEKSVEKKCGKQ
jgi:hypothetical protein